MKLLLGLGVCTLFILLVHGQSTPDPQCVDVGDFVKCHNVTTEDAFKCNTNSACFCKDKKPFCRCNNYINEWFIGENCDMKWTTVSFALVASLPGLGLAVFVGVIVYMVKNPSKKNKQNKKGKANAAFKQEQEDDMIRNMVFASDLKERPRPPPESMRPPNHTVPMAAMPNRDYSTRLPALPGPAYPNRPFDQSNSQQRDFHPAQDRSSMGGPPPQSNSYGSGMGPAPSNPYAKSSPGRPLYEGQGPPQGYGSDYGYRPKQPPVNGTRVMAADFPHSSSSHPSFPRPNYSAPDRHMINGRF